MTILKLNVLGNYVLPYKGSKLENYTWWHGVCIIFFEFDYLSCVQAGPFVWPLEVSCDPRKYGRCSAWFDCVSGVWILVGL